MNINKIHQISEVYKTSPVKKVNSKNVREQRQDQLELSDQAKSFQLAYKTIKNSPDTREDRVNDIKDRINSGTYNVSAEQIAEKLMAKGFDKLV